MIEAVAHDEFVFDLKSDIFHLHGDLAPARLAQQAGGFEAFGVSSTKYVLQVRKGQTRVDDIFDDDDVTALKGCVEIFEQSNFSGSFCGRAVTRDGNEIQRHLPRHGSRQIRQEDEGTFEHSDKVKGLTGGIICIDLRGHLANARVNLFCCKQRRHGDAKR